MSVTRFLFVTGVAVFVQFLGRPTAAQTVCPTTAIANGNPADATLVTNWFSCKAPTNNPLLTGNVGINQTSPLLAGLNVTGNQFITGSSAGASSIGFSLFNLQLGPTQPRSLVANSYYSGIAFNHLLNADTTGYYNRSPQAWIGTRLYDTPGSERDYLVFATKSSTGTSDVPIERVAISPFGNVGIGTMTPGQKLDVSGTIRQTGCMIAGTLSTNTSGDIICTSDARLKNIIGLYKSGLDVIERIEPSRFTYKTTASNPVETFVHAGFIAQDVKEVIPEAVAVQRSGYYSLDTTAILAASINAIKELKASNDRQSAKIALQDRKIDALMTSMKEIQRHLHVQTASN